MSIDEHRAHNIVNIVLIAVFLIAGLPGAGLQPAEAQLNGANTRGDYGLLSGAQPGPGTYVSAFFYNYSFSDFKTQAGNTISSDEGINAWAFAPFFIHTTNAKILGANYGFAIAPSLVNVKVELPRLDVDESSVGLADTYVMPIWLGWQFPQAEIMATTGVFIPTGRYEPGGDDNIGLGMWSFEVGLGGNAYFNEQRTVHLATMGFLEFHTDKQDSDTHVGTLLTLEGGLGVSLLQGGLLLGGTYFAQWKLSGDRFVLPNELDVDLTGSKHRVFGVGPEATLFVLPLRGTVTARYLFDTGARSMTEGNTFVFAYTYWFTLPAM